MEAQSIGLFNINSVPMPESSMKQRITNFVHLGGGGYSEWYVGLAGDIEKDLFRAHRVSRVYDEFTYFMADTPRTAKRVKRYYVEKGMCDGERCPPGERWVYVYRVSKGTRQ